MHADSFALELEGLLSYQAGVVGRRQLLDLGAEPHDIARLVRRRELARIHPGVFVDHTGTPTWVQRGWAACLSHWPAALAGPSALRAVLGPGWRHHDDSGPIHVAIDQTRRCRELPGQRVHRVTDLDGLVVWGASPPRIRIEDAALDLALTRTDRLAQIALLADVCQSGRTTADRVLETLGARNRVRDRSWLTEMLTDVADGTCSTLEHGYLTR